MSNELNKRIEANVLPYEKNWKLFLPSATDEPNSRLLPAVRATHGAKTVSVETSFAKGITRERIRQLVDVYKFSGDLRKTGIIVSNTYGEITAAMRGPNTIPLTKEDKGEYIQVTFGGEQTPKHIEKSNLREFGLEDAAEVARNIIDAARTSVHLPFFSSRRGTEIESFRMRINPDGTLSIVRAPYEKQEELVRGMEEVALPMALTIEEGMQSRAKHVIASITGFNEFLLNTGVALAGTALDEGLKINDGKYREYVAEVAAKLRTSMGRFDNYGGQVADFVAREMGYKNLEEMVEKEPTMAYWFAAAGHHSVSLPHIATGHNEYVVPTEIAIAAADVAASDMGKVAELLMYSSPLILGNAPAIQTPEGEKYPLDYRDFFRHLMGTTFPGDLIRDPQTLYERWATSIIQEETHTIDRAAFRANIGDQSFSSCHGPVRLRAATSSTGEPVNRIESTGPGSSFSLLDEYARDVLLDVFNLAAFEASAHGVHPADYFGGRYPSLTGSSQRMDIGRGYNLNGPSDPLAGQVIGECLSFLEEMAEKYPPYAKNIAIAQSRIFNLRKQASARNFEEYATRPVGPVSQVMQHMYYDGLSEGLSAQLAASKAAQAAAQYEVVMARALLENKGDAIMLVNGIVN